PPERARIHHPRALQSHPDCLPMQQVQPEEARLQKARTRHRMNQLDLFAPRPAPASQEAVEWLVGRLRGRDWQTAQEILEASDLQVTDAAKRRLRSLANASKGRIAGGQKGYKLVKEMTAAEFGG